MNKTAHCSECDSEGISGQAEVAWDAKLQEWTPLAMIDCIYCGDCGEPCSVVWRYENSQDLVHCPECDKQGRLSQLVYEMFDKGAELVEGQTCPKCNYIV